ncbi:MAG: hypothetical protein KatS3mg011_0285 [Acidimicrobiia bacterium]|nr:MAG: hypothetical protein KatS3mg011_0285 [Acidimicrobiia bacterium]
MGTGIVSTAIKAGECPPEVAAAAVATMATLNRAAAETMLEVGVHAATDVTGFGLLGHLHELLVASGVDARVGVSSVPVLDGAWDLLDKGMYPSGSARNVAAVTPHLAGEASNREVRMLCDAQTSGGLLIAVGVDRVERLLDRLEARGVTAAVVGEVLEGDGGYIWLAP